MPMMGLSNLVYAVMTGDPAGGAATYLAIQNVPGVVQADVKPKTQFGIFYSDDAATEAATALGEMQMDIDVGELPLQVYADWLGHTYQNGQVIHKSTDSAPYIAIGFKALKSDQVNYRYYWFFKGKFTEPDQSHKTKSDKVDFQTTKISGNFVRRLSDNAYRLFADSIDPTFTGAATWFNAVGGGVPDTVPPTITAVAPANNAVGQNANTTVQWTFSEAILVSTVTSDNFIVQKADGSAQVAGTLALDGTKKIVTFTPAAALAATTQYMAIVGTGLKDLSGNKLAATSATRFTTT